MAPIDYGVARKILEELMESVERGYLEGTNPGESGRFKKDCNLVFASKTQAYREVLLGCTVARILDKSIDIRKPYVDQGPNAFSGRSLDERAINPFLQEKRIPCSRGPYLSVFRRSVQFTDEIRLGLRDKKGYDALLRLIARLEETSDDPELMEFLRSQVYRFVAIREAANIPLTRLQRISLNQYEALISDLLSRPSGGLLPVLLVVATVNMLKQHFRLSWTITWQGINVADAPSGAGGDITITDDEETILAVEVTERQVDSTRLTATFNTKIAPSGLRDYLFLLGSSAPDEVALRQAQRYFAQGHEVNFVRIKEWILMLLVATGIGGRTMFNSEMLELLDHPEVPQTVKAYWNECIESLLEGESSQQQF